jgi:hypothetical protein
MPRPTDDDLRPRKKKAKKKPSSSVNWAAIGGTVLGILVLLGAIGKFIRGYTRARDAATGQTQIQTGGSGFWKSEDDNKVLSQNNLKQIGLALHNYHDVSRMFPAGAVVRDSDQVTTGSWSICILPFVDQPLYQRYDHNKAWNGPENQPVISTSLPVFLFPGGSGAVSNYAGNSHLFTTNQNFTLSQISDGASNTLLIGEVSAGLKSWADPSNVRDLSRGLGATADQFGGTFSGGCQILLVDGQVKFLSDKTDPTVLKAIATPAGGEVVNSF